MYLKMSNLIEIQSQIEKLTKQASEIRAREFDKTVQDILAKMSAFGITVKDLQPGKARAAGKRKIGKAGKSAGAGALGANAKATRKSAGKVVAPKFRGPNGETWSGRGLMPRWLSALVAQGKAKEDFAIKG
jgi:DNA-binding protein H-NS